MIIFINSYTAMFIDKKENARQASYFGYDT